MAGPARCSTCSASRASRSALEFDKLLHDGRRASSSNGCRTCGPTPLPIDAAAFLAGLPAELRTRVAPLCEQPKIRLLRDESKMRLAHLIASAAQAVNDGRCTLAAAVQFVDWLEPLLRRESYLALLAERPEVQKPAPALARPGALADAVPDAASWRHRRARGRAPAARSFRGR
jgi:glutamate-ammonia-ligase adenylyltransferase